MVLRHCILRGLLRAIIVALIAMHATVLADGVPPMKVANDFLDLARNGDIIFRRGTGLFSEYFRKAGGAEAPYSHVGIIIQEKECLYVVHAEASDYTGIGRVIKEPLNKFVSREKALLAGLYRLRDPLASIASHAAVHAESFATLQIPFDNNFDSVSHDKLYCTELVQWAYELAGLQLVEQLDTLVAPGRNIKIISISNLIGSNKLAPVMGCYSGGVQ